MKTIRTLLLACLLFTGCVPYAQNKSIWNGKKCAVALTYDDALNIHLDKVVPALDSVGFKATFYLITSREAFTKRIPEWRAVAAKGYELGNHTMYHPCYGKRPGREWVQPDYDMNNYTLQRMTDEVRMTSTLLYATDGKTKRTLGCPCGDTRIGDSSYITAVKDQFVAFRDGTPDANAANNFGKVTVEWMGPNNNTGEELIAAVKKAMQDNAFLIFVFHGVGGEHSINVSAKAHTELLQFLKQNESQVWVAPFIDISEHIKANK
jgi:sialate O-acetylesterase